MKNKTLDVKVTPHLQHLLSEHARSVSRLLEIGLNEIPDQAMQHVLEALREGAHIQLTTALTPHMSVTAALRHESEAQYAVLFTLCTEHVLRLEDSPPPAMAHPTTQVATMPPQ